MYYTFVLQSNLMFSPDLLGQAGESSGKTVIVDIIGAFPS